MLLLPLAVAAPGLASASGESGVFAEASDPATQPDAGSAPSMPATSPLTGSPAASAGATDPGPGLVVVVTFDDLMINRGSKEYLLDSLADAASDPTVRAFVLVMDTPGGSLQDTREIVKAFLSSQLPIVVYVSPAGSRAASAGVFITMAAHVAAMAPATNIGAAHPVLFAPAKQKPEDEESKKAAQDSEAAMLEKVTEDTAAFGRNIAKERGRNADWAEKAVRDSVSITVAEAVELGVVDLEVASLDALLQKIEGRELRVADGRKLLLHTLGPRQDLAMRPAQKTLYALTHPTVAFLLLMVGLSCLWLEFNKPGLIIPGATGIVALLLAAFSLSAIPVNALALIFVVLGFSMLVAEIYVPSHGLLTVGGIASLSFGGLFLVRTGPEFTVGVDPAAVGLVVLMVLALALLIGWLVLRAHKAPVHGGHEGMRGERGEVRRAIPGGAARGRVFVHSEIWDARADAPLTEGVQVEVLAVEGMVLLVREVKPALSEKT
jgi:membrane-bound serine protease (ClpP class)